MIIQEYLKSNKLSLIFQNKTAKQTSVLFSAQFFLLIVSVFTSIINARYLGPSGYGIYSFVLAVISFISIFFGFGFSGAGARIIALASNDIEERKLIGVTILIGICVSILFSITIFVSSFFIDNLFKSNIDRLLLYISLISGVLPFQAMITRLFRGGNRINDLAFFNVFPKIWYLGCVLIVINVTNLTPLISVCLNLVAIIIACIIAIHRLKPIFKNKKENLRLLLKETREYGFHVYLGAVADTSTYRLDKLFIASFTTITSVGFYNLAYTLVSPMVNLSNAMSNSLFKGFTKAKRIDKKIILINFTWLLTCFVILIIMGKFIVVKLFTEKYLPMVPLIFPLALGCFFQGMYTPFNMFLSAHRKGKELRFIAFTEAIFNLIGNFTLIYLYGALGAAVACAIAKGIELSLNLYFYKKLVVKTKS